MARNSCARLPCDHRSFRKGFLHVLQGGLHERTLVETVHFFIVEYGDRASVKCMLNADPDNAFPVRTQTSEKPALIVWWLIYHVVRM